MFTFLNFNVFPFNLILIILRTGRKDILQPPSLISVTGQWLNRFMIYLLSIRLLASVNSEPHNLLICRRQITSLRPLHFQCSALTCLSYTGKSSSSSNISFFYLLPYRVLKLLPTLTILKRACRLLSYLNMALSRFFFLFFLCSLI